MCVVSNAYDYWKPFIPEPAKVEPFVINQTIDLSELKQIIKEFRESIDLAKRLDVLMKQKDCVDADKAKLEQRVAELEQIIKKHKGKKLHGNR